MDNERITAGELASRKHLAKHRIVDIRKNPDDREIPGSIRLEAAALENGTDIPFQRDERIVLYCGSGNSCSRVAQRLRERGYDAVALEGGYKAWVEAGLPTVERRTAPARSSRPSG